LVIPLDMSNLGIVEKAKGGDEVDDILNQLSDEESDGSGEEYEDNQQQEQEHIHEEEAKEIDALLGHTTTEELNRSRNADSLLPANVSGNTTPKPTKEEEEAVKRAKEEWQRKQNEEDSDRQKKEVEQASEIDLLMQLAASDAEKAKQREERKKKREDKKASKKAARLANEKQNLASDGTASTSVDFLKKLEIPQGPVTLYFNTDPVNKDKIKKKYRRKYRKKCKNTIRKIKKNLKEKHDITLSDSSSWSSTDSE